MNQILLKIKDFFIENLQQYVGEPVNTIILEKIKCDIDRYIVNIVRSCDDPKIIEELITEYEKICNFDDVVSPIKVDVETGTVSVNMSYVIKNIKEEYGRRIL